MSAEKIIHRIKTDAEKEIHQILKEAEKHASSIISDAKNEAEREAEKILADSTTQSENIRKILVSKATQDVKREIMKAREDIIDECFTKAYHTLSTLREGEYRRVVAQLIEDGCKKLAGKYTLAVSRDIDREIAERAGVQVRGTIKASGGVLIKSDDERVTIDNTFDGILKRKQDEIRVQVGKLLFSSDR